MSIETTTLPSSGSTEAGDQTNPYRYGWRYVQHTLPDGRQETIEVPLTLEDVLHPEEGDQVTHSDDHQRRCDYLYDVLRARVASDPSTEVLHDVRIAWDVPELKAHGPDLMVIFGVREHKNWSTFDVAQEGVRPTLIIEVTSPETRSIDRLDKLDEYEAAGVPLYIIVDMSTHRKQTTLRLLGYQLTRTTYEVLPLDEQGRLWLAPVRLWLGIRDNELFCYDEHGVQFGNYVEVNAARVVAEARAEEEARARAAAEVRAEAAETRLRELEEELRRLRGE